MRRGASSAARLATPSFRTGEARFKQWRRGYTTRPPAASSFSPSYPGNDERYVRYLTDVRYSFRESLVRSLASGFVLARKIPKAESLKGLHGPDYTVFYGRDLSARCRTEEIGSCKFIRERDPRSADALV